MSAPGLVSRYDPPAFSGETFSEELDGERLMTLLARVRFLMLDGGWRTLSEIQAVTGGSEASVSARLRDLRKEGWTVERRRKGDPTKGLYEYRATPHTSEVVK